MRATHRGVLGRSVAIALCGALTLTSCSLLDRGDKTSSGGAIEDGVESGMPADAVPVRGGQLIYGLEAETDPAEGGYCLPDAQLVISGIQVARAFYDPLVTPDADGNYVPYLARSITPQDDYKVWDIGIRDGVTFHDGTKLDAKVVKNNLDAYRGAYPGRSALLIASAFTNIDKVEVLNEGAVRVHMKEPWVAFPASLYGSGRVMMVAQKQLDASPEDCATKPIGTGPFVFDRWDVGVSIRGKRNPSYWQQAPDATEETSRPYLDAVEFRPMSNSDARMAALQQGEINMMHTSTPSDMATTLPELRDAGDINLLVSNNRTESEYVLINASGKNGANPILKDPKVRRAITQAIDRNALNNQINHGVPQLANGPFPPGVLGYLEDTGEPTYDKDAAKKVVDELIADGKSVKLRLLTGTSPSFVQVTAAEKRMLEEVGFEITLQMVKEADLVTTVIEGDYDLSSMRNQPGEDPDANAFWWRGGSNILNFGKFNDDVIDKQLEIGRTNPDPDARKAAYETINKRFAEQQFNVYLWWAPWAVAEASDVHGILGPELPDAGEPSRRLVTGHPLHGIWIDR